MAASLTRKLHIVDVGTTEVVLSVHQNWLPYKTFLDRLLPPELRSDRLWSSSIRFETQQILTGGPCVTLKPNGYCAPTHFLPVKHAEYSRLVQGARIILGEHPHRLELFFIPILADQGNKGKAYPAFWGYLVHDGVTLSTGNWIEKSQLPVILDLDETLLVAHSASQLQSDIARLSKNRNHCMQEATTATPERKRQLEAEQSAMEQEITNFKRDAAWLEQYTQEDAVTSTKGALKTTFQARYESAQLDDGRSFQRPVVRLPGGVVLTRIDPLRPITSMIMRIRPGWEELRSYLAPDPKKSGPGVSSRRFDVFVCTAAERPYALEAWRLLDSRHDSCIIPQASRGTRIVCVPKGQIKELSAVLGCQKPLSCRPDGALVDEPRSCAMPLAIIVDDRIDVWEPESRGQVLQVAPFAPHRPIGHGQDQMNNPEERQAMADEMVSVKGRLGAVRGHMHYAIKHSLTPAVQRFLQTMHPLDAVMSTSAFFPAIKSVAELLKVPGLTTAGLSDAVTHMQAGQGVPNLAHGNGRMLAPQDSVNMRNGPTTQAQTNAAAPVSLLPVDVRKQKKAGPNQAAPNPAPPRTRSSPPQAVPMTSTALPPPITLAAPHPDPRGLHQQVSGSGAGPSAHGPHPQTLHRQGSGPGAGPANMGLQQLSLHHHQQQQTHHYPLGQVSQAHLPNHHQVPQTGPQDPRRQMQQPQVSHLHPGHLQQRPQVSLQQQQQPPSLQHQQLQQQQQQQPASGLHALLQQQQQAGATLQQQPGFIQDSARLPGAGLAQGIAGVAAALAHPGMRQPGVAPPATQMQTSATGSLKPLSVNLALPLIRQKMGQASYNPINALKEASERQKVFCKHVELNVPQPTGSHPMFGHQVQWEGQDIGSAQAHDKKTAKKEAAQKAVDFLLQLGTRSRSASATQSDASQPSTSGAQDSIQSVPGTRLRDSTLISELNALNLLQKAYPKGVSWRPGSHLRGLHGETLMVDDQHHVVRGWKGKLKNAQRWAAMRLLMELGHQIDPAFFKDTPEGRSKGSVGPLYADFLTNTEVLVFDGVARPQGWTQYSSFHRHAPPPTQTPSQDAPAPLLTQKPSQGAPGPSQQHVHVQPVAPAAELNSQHSRPQAQQQPQGNVKGQGHQREASQTHDKVQGQDQTKAEHSKAQGQEQQQGPLKEVPQAQGQGNSRQLVHSGSKGQAQKPGKNHAEGQPPSKSQKLGHAPGQKTSQAQTQKQEQGPVSAVPGSRGQKRPASAPPASSGDVPQPKRAKPTAQVAAQHAAESAHAAVVRANADRLAEAGEPSSPERIADADQDDSLAEAMSEGDAAADVGHQSGYMLEDSPEIDDVPMEEDKQTHESPERQSDDVDRGSSLSHPLNSLRGPKQKQATKDVNALHDVRNPEFFAAAQQQSKVKEGDWAEVKLGESDGSGNVVVID